MQVDVGLTEFAADFESVFAGFDGAGSKARLAVRSDTPDLSAPSPRPSGRCAGAPAATESTSASRPSPLARTSQRQPAPPYFSLAPLAVELKAGVAPVPAYDAQLHATYADRTFEGIDLDAWAQTFLRAMDPILAPSAATVVAAVDPVTYANLMLAKSVLAQALGKGVTPVYEPNVAGMIRRRPCRSAGPPQAGRARQPERGVLDRVGRPGPGRDPDDGSAGALTPRLFGAFGVRGADDSDVDGATVGVTVSSAKLKIAPSTVAAPAFLNFLVSVSDASAVANAGLELEWRTCASPST